jgi:hypothetical protein
MFKYPISLPKVTREDVARMHAAFPNIAQVAVVPVIDSEAVAVATAHLVVTDSLATSEVITETISANFNETTQSWDIVFQIFGD